MKKMISILLTVLLVLGTISMTASAALDVTQATIVIGTVDELKELATIVNEGNALSGKTVALASDLDLNNEEWIPIGMSGKPFSGTFDGGNHTIANLKITGNNSNVGLFGFTTNGSLKNFTIENAEVAGYLNVGAVAGTPYTSTYDNITVTGLIKVDGYAYVGAMFGKNAYANLSNLTVDADEESYVKANSENYRTYVGGIVGFMGEGSHSVSNVVSNIDVYGSTCDVGGITGIIHYNNKFINCVSSGDVAVTAYNDDGDQLESGGIAGVWHNENGTSITVKDCYFTGSLSATKADGTVYTGEFENNGLIGKAYSDSKTGVMNLIYSPANIDGTYYDTLQEALDNAAEGDTIQLMPTVIEESTIKMPATITNLTIQGAPDKKTIIKNSVLQTADGNNISYNGLTIEGLLFENSNIVLTGWRTGTVNFDDITIKNNTFQNIVKDSNQAAIHINTGEHEVITNLTIENNIIDGVSGSSNSGIYAQADGEITIKNNVINNVAFRPYVISVNNANETEDSLNVTGNIFSGSAKGRAQALGTDAEGTDAVSLTINNNIFKDIDPDQAQQICYWNFNNATSTIDFSHNYYDIDIAEHYNRFYYNDAATSPANLLTFTVYPYYNSLTEDGVIDIDSLVTGSEYAAASIDEVYFATLPQAIYKASSENSIQLLTDAVLDVENYSLIQEKVLSLELGTYTLTVNALDDASACITIPENYKLRKVPIMDSADSIVGYEYYLTKLFNAIDSCNRGGSDHSSSSANKTPEEESNKKPSEEPTKDPGINDEEIFNVPDKEKIVLEIGSTSTLVFGKTVSIDVAPKIVNNRTMLPARFVAESLGATVNWTPAAPDKIEILMEGVEILITIGQNTALVNGVETVLDSPAFIENDRTFLPIRFISESLGAKVHWDTVTQTVTIMP